MSRFLTKSRVAFLLAMLVLLMISFVVGVVFGPLFVLVALLVIVLFCIACVLNWVARRKNQRVCGLFSLDPNLPRNFDYLVVGDFCDVSDFIPQGSSVAFFQAPGRGLYASLLVFKHVFSLLKDGGTAVFAVRKSTCSSSNISLWDFPFLHRTIVDSLKLHAFARKSRFPLVYDPVSSLRIILNLRGNPLYDESFENEEVFRFCIERNLRVKLLVF